jgi:hypothetical protein
LETVFPDAGAADSSTESVGKAVDKIVEYWPGRLSFGACRWLVQKCARAGLVGGKPCKVLIFMEYKALLLECGNLPRLSVEKMACQVLTVDKSAEVHALLRGFSSVAK